LDYEKLIAPLIKIVQEQKVDIENLWETVENHRLEIDNLKNRNPLTLN
jgi:hypothetical protein